ncbi:MAG: hypothetical protein U0790_07020 [Isosphaeraceae bacterium]
MYGPDHTLTFESLEDRGAGPRSGPIRRGGIEARRCIDGYAKGRGLESSDLATLRADLGLNYLRKGEPAQAEHLFRGALGVYDKLMPDNWRRFEIQGQLGESLAFGRSSPRPNPWCSGATTG